MREETNVTILGCIWACFEPAPNAGQGSPGMQQRQAAPAAPRSVEERVSGEYCDDEQPPELRPTQEIVKGPGSFVSGAPNWLRVSICACCGSERSAPSAKRPSGVRGSGQRLAPARPITISPTHVANHHTCAADCDSASPRAARRPCSLAPVG